MEHTRLTRYVAETRLASAAALPLRLGAVTRHCSLAVRRSASWLMRSREHVHYTYDLEPINQEHLAWLVATTTGCAVADARGYMTELREDDQLRGVVTEGLSRSPRRATTDPVLRFGRRIGWYAFVRALRPQFVVETGTNRGLGSAVIAAALLRNGSGTLSTVDLDPRGGELILPPYRDVIEHTVGDSLPFLQELARRGRPIDLLAIDTGYTAEHERAELAAATPVLSEDAIVLATKSYCWQELSRWSEEQGRQFLYFAEEPRDHWYPGVGIGVSIPGRVARIGR